MIKLDFPDYQFRLRKTQKRDEIFDPIRKKFICLTPEEWVRQHVLHFLMDEKKMPAGRINVEFSLNVLEISRRADIIVFDHCGNPVLIAECKAPHVKITQAHFEQISRYNISMKAKYLLVTNGLQHYFCEIDFENQSYNFLPQIPPYSEMQP